MAMLGSGGMYIGLEVKKVKGDSQSETRKEDESSGPVGSLQLSNGVGRVGKKKKSPYNIVTDGKTSDLMQFPPLMTARHNTGTSALCLISRD
jgi:hypothetical protein